MPNTQSPYHNQHVWIIGASAGIGEALARELAGRGAHLILSARSEDSLKTLNQELGGGHAVLPLDVTDKEACQGAIDTVLRTCGKIDRVIFMAAYYDPADVADMSLERALKTVEVNFTGALQLLYPLSEALLTQGHGQIAVCASVAGYRGLPGGQPYCATKAALINFTETMRVEMQPKGLDIRVINPGFVKTRLTDKNDFAMPMMITPKKPAAAKCSTFSISRWRICKMR